MNVLPKLKTHEQALLAMLSFVLVAFGQPAWSSWLGVIASMFGYSLFWRILLDFESGKDRFWLSVGWFFSVQLVQIYWMVSHPYSYIYAVYFGLSFILGLLCGVFGYFVTLENIQRSYRLIALASLWTLLEWSHLFFFSGYSFNPAGIALSGNLYSLQFASFWGTFGLSFWIIIVNLAALRAWVYLPAKNPALIWAVLAGFPYLYGFSHLTIRNSEFEHHLTKDDPYLHIVLVQTAFPAEEALPFKDKSSYIAFVMDEWAQVLNITKQHIGKKIDLIVLPEYVVPFGTYTFLYPYDHVKSSFEKAFGTGTASRLPPKAEPFARPYQTSQGEAWFVNNAFWTQGIANVFQAEVVAGLEDAEDNEEGQRTYFSSAILFRPNATPETFNPDRYAKRVLLPMAEYIPFSFCKDLAARYGIQGSFTCGGEALVMQGCKTPFGLSICYEETFGNLMRESRVAGSELLVNLTSDVWYPNSRLPQQHFDHARLRTVEAGIPLIRSCNTGITCAFDSLGRVVSRLGEDSFESEWVADSLYAKVPTFHYPTIYTTFGDSLIVGICLIGMLFFFVKRK